MSWLLSDPLKSAFFILLTSKVELILILEELQAWGELFESLPVFLSRIADVHTMSVAGYPQINLFSFSCLFHLFFSLFVWRIVA